MIKGSCLCGGGVTYELEEPLRDALACHCTQCRKTSGHYWSATNVANQQFHITKSETLKWYQSSKATRRGFCDACGSSLFWQRQGADNISIGAGTLDAPTGITTSGHIFIDDKGDYYEIEG